MLASDHIQSLPNYSDLPPDTLARLREAAFPGYGECTGCDLRCSCSWHQWRRERDPSDPYGFLAAVARQKRRWAADTARELRAQLPEIIRDYPELLAGHLDAIAACERASQ